MSANWNTSAKLRTGWVAIALAGLMALVACGDDGDDDDDSGGTNTGSSSNCTHSFQCVGSSCECTTTGKEGTACCDPEDCGNDSNNCESVCQVCS